MQSGGAAILTRLRAKVPERAGLRDEEPHLAPRSLRLSGATLPFRGAMSRGAPHYLVTRRQFCIGQQREQGPEQLRGVGGQPRAVRSTGRAAEMPPPQP